MMVRVIIFFFRFSTQIVLPLKDNLQAATLAKKFHDVQPSLLLFLHRLRSITIEDQVLSTVRLVDQSAVMSMLAPSDLKECQIHDTNGWALWSG